MPNTNESGTTTIRAEVQNDHLQRLAARMPLTALAELVWNAVDGDATDVAITIDENGMGGLQAIVVSDNGSGIPRELALQAFKNVGLSWKKGRRSPKGRAFHGEKGEGRYTAFALGTRVAWLTRWRSSDGMVRSYEVVGRTDDPRDFEVSAAAEANGRHTGTEVEISNISRVPRCLLADDAILRIAEMFAVYLRQYPDVRVRFCGRQVDPGAVQERPPVDYSLDDLVKDDGNAVNATLTVIEWKHAVERDLFLCDEEGCALATKKVGIRAKGYQFTAYLKSPLLRERQGLLEMEELQVGDLTRMLEKAKEQLRAHFKRRAAEDARALVDQWRAEKIYPYEGTPKSPVDEVERQVFDVVAFALNEHLPSFADSTVDAKRLSFELLKAAIEESPSAVRRVVQEFLNLPPGKRDELVELLDRTSLGHIISASKVVVDRLDFVEGLEVVLFHHEVKQKTKERKQLHRLLAENTWVFGEEFHLAVDDQSLTEVLRQHLRILGREPNEGLAPVELADGGKGIVDLMLAKKVPLPRGDEFEHLVVELKRPSQKLNEDVLTQVKKYAFAVANDERFRTSKVRWTFWALSNDANEFARREARQSHRPPGLVHQDGNISIWVKTWNEILDECKGRLRFFREQLDYMATEETGVAHLRRMHAQFIPDAMRDDLPQSEVHAVADGSQPPREDGRLSEPVTANATVSAPANDPTP